MAHKLAKSIRPPQLIELVGDLGGGKTAFVKALAKGLGITKTVTSPTFTIHQSYEIPGGGSPAYRPGRLEHFDFYRLSDDEIVRNELKDVLDAGSAIVCVEWAQNFHSVISEDRLAIQFEFINDKSRKLTMTATGPKSRKLLEALR